MKNVVVGAISLYTHNLLAGGLHEILRDRHTACYEVPSGQASKGAQRAERSRNATSHQTFKHKPPGFASTRRHKRRKQRDYSRTRHQQKLDPNSPQLNTNLPTAHMMLRTSHLSCAVHHHVFICLHPGNINCVCAAKSASNRISDVTVERA